MRRVLAVLLVCVVVVLFMISTRNPADPEPPAPDLTALSVSSCGGGVVDEVTAEGVVFCQPDQLHADVSTITAGEMVSRLWWILAGVFGCFLLMGFSNLWNGRAG